MTSLADRAVAEEEFAGVDPDLLREVPGPGAAPPDHHHLRRAADARPNVSDLADLIPADVPDEWSAYLHDRADTATERHHELGAQIAEHAPRWALDALGSVLGGYTDILGRQEWDRRAGWAGAYRELVGWDDEREKAHRARTELRARGIDPDDPEDRVTAEEWLAAHHDEQADAERTRETHDDYELDQPDTDDRFDDHTADRDGQVRLEPAPADWRTCAEFGIGRLSSHVVRRAVACCC